MFCSLFALTGSVACGAAEKLLEDFEDSEGLALFEGMNSSFSHVEHEGNGAVLIHLDSESNYKSSFSLKPETPWDWSGEGEFAVAFDVRNPMSTSMHLYVTTRDASGGSQIRSLVAPAGVDKTFYIELNVPSLSTNSGIRSNPPSWKTEYSPVIWRGGTKKLNVAGIESIGFDVRGVLEDKKLIVDNLRLVYPNEYDEGFLKGLVDQFGQNAKLDFDYKISSEEELKERWEEEQSQLVDSPLAGRSKFNGWADGPQLEATGYFRVEKYRGKWSLVDPEGYLFFSNGIANVRMANTSTMTGYDFDEEKIRVRGAEDLTPEDSLGLNPVAAEAVSSRRVSLPLRADMFTWLPGYDEPIGKHFGYRREVHSGPMKKGETFSFYRANLARKFGSSEPDVFMPKWREVTVDRMLTWGFTSFGNWIDPSFYQMDRFPYFANGWIIGDFKKVSSGSDYWGALPDPFDPVFEERALATVRQIAEEVQNSPWCVGVFIDNEMSWGLMGSVCGSVFFYCSIGR